MKKIGNKAIKIFGIGAAVLFLLMAFAPAASAITGYPGLKIVNFSEENTEEGKKYFMTVKETSSPGGQECRYQFSGTEEDDGELYAIFYRISPFNDFQRTLKIKFPVSGDLILTAPNGDKLKINRDGECEIIPGNNGISNIFAQINGPLIESIADLSRVSDGISSDQLPDIYGYKV